MRRSRGIAFATIIVVMLAASLSSARAQPAPTEPALFDLALAQANLDEILNKIEKLQTDLEVAFEDIEGLTIERDFIRLNDKGRNEIMQDSRTRARNMAINAYVGIGPPLSGVVILDAETANDLSYRHGLLRQQAERLHQAAETYSVLAGEADASVLDLADSINDKLRRTEALNRALNRELAKVENAEWIVSIARIHHKADTEFEKSGRVDPTQEEWRKLRFCESTETYNIDTGNTFYGAYQFTQQTWITVDGDGNPAHAPPAEQDARARLLYATRGNQPWPICGRYLP